MANNFGDLFVELGTVGNSKDLEKFVAKVKEGVIAIERQMELQEQAGKKSKKSNEEEVKGVAGVVSKLGTLITTLSLVGVAWNKMTDELVRTNQEMLNLTRTSDIALSTFQKYDTLGKMFGVSGLAGQLESLNQRIFELQLTGQGARGFQLAGINPVGMNTEDFIAKLRDRVAGLNDTTASYMLQQMGLNPKMLVFLRKDYEDLWQTVKRYQLTEKQRKEIEKLNVQLQISRIKMQYIKDRVVMAFMPALVKISESIASIVGMFAKLGNLLTKNNGLGLRATLLTVTALSLKFKTFGNFIKDIGKGLSGMISKIPIVGKLFGSLGKFVSKALFPLLALWYILDDLAVFFEGGDSLIGDVLNWSKEKGSQIGEAFSKMFGGDVFGGLGELANTLVDILNDILEAVKKISEIILDFLTLGLWHIFKKNGSDEENHPYLTKFRKFVFPTTEEMMEDLTKNRFVTPAMDSSVSNNKTNYNNKNVKISMNNTIYTTQPVGDLQNELDFMQRQYALG